ncbi:MAG: FHA domain-containing protein, partial [Candidatus Competibacterales bacterium]
QEPSPSTAAAVPPPMDFPAGWLAVVEGPGRGAVLGLSSGPNTIGRDFESRVRIDFGDHDIALQDHALILYDPQQRSFRLTRGEGKRPVTVDDVPLTRAIPLRGGEFITLGRTTLRFIPLCDDRFDWAEGVTKTPR